MAVTVMLAFILPCSVMSAAFAIYFSLMWYSSFQTESDFEPDKPGLEVGMSAAELAELPKVTGKDLIMEPECAICLEQIEIDQAARLLPTCNHGFHLQCADTWLSRNSICPVCRVRVKPDLLDPENPC